MELNFFLIQCNLKYSLDYIVKNYLTIFYAFFFFFAFFFGDVIYDV